MNSEQIKWLAELIKTLDAIPSGMYIGSPSNIYVKDPLSSAPPQVVFTIKNTL